MKVRRRQETATESDVRALPNLVVIGGMKCGTTSLHHYLDAHPSIAMSEQKELNFFYRERRWELGLPWYSAKFDPEAEVRGESSVNYTKSPKVGRLVSQRIDETLDEVRLIYLVRDPVERAVSHYFHTYAKGNMRLGPSATIRRLDSVFVQRSLFYANLEPYLERFSADRIMVIDQHELYRRRAETLRAVFSFLRVDEDYDSEAFGLLWQAGAPKLQRMEEDDGGTQPLPPQRRQLKPDVIERLRDFFQEDVERLRAATGKSFETWSV